MAIKSLAHAGLVVRDLEKTRWFYSQVLGLEEIPRPRTFKFRGAWFRLGADEIHVFVEGDTVAPAGFPDPGKAVHMGLATHLAFEVDDLAAMQARLADAGVTIQGGPIPRGDGVMQIFVQDPDGYLLEFFQWVAGSEVGAPDRGAIR